MSLMSHAERELDRIGLTGKTPEELANRKNILKIVEEFQNAGHQTQDKYWWVEIIIKLLRGEPLSPIEDGESDWYHKPVYFNNKAYYQHKRCYKIYKSEDGIYNREGLMFWKWQDVDGVKQKQYYITHLSLTPITLPSEVETFVQYKEEDDEPI